MKFGNGEIKELFFAWILISLAFAILFSGGFFGIFGVGFVISLGIAGLTAGIGFLLHELMHKYVAQQYGLYARFKVSYRMLGFAILASFAGFIFAAPGAVMIGGNITRERNGKISLAGPMTNVVLAILFLIFLLLGDFDSNFLGLFFDYGFRINSLLALFNMVPAIPFDGAKVLAWNKEVYYISGAIALGLFLVGLVI